MARVRAALGCSTLALVFVVLFAAPASAHGTAQVPATDYVVRVQTITPPVAGLSVRVVDNGARIELRNDGATEVTVLGYGDSGKNPEPYLRVGPNGVFENTRSPAVFWNKVNAITNATPPPQYNAAYPPAWKRISTGHAARWHDHRAHYTGAVPSGHNDLVVLRFDLPLTQNGRAVHVFGDVRYVAPTSPAPYLVLALVLAVGLFVLSRWRGWPAVLGVSLTVLVAAALLQLVGEWGAVTLSLPSRIAEHVYVFAGIALGIGSLAWSLRRRSSPYDATPIALLAGVALLLASGLTGLPLLTHSEIPTTWSPPLDRLLVALTIGSGLAVVAIAATRLRPPFQARPRDQESSTATEILRSMYVEK